MPRNWAETENKRNIKEQKKVGDSNKTEGYLNTTASTEIQTQTVIFAQQHVELRKLVILAK